MQAALARLGVRRLDTLVISHLHADHTGGLPSLVAQYRPRRAWVAGAVRGSLATALRGAGTTIVQARRGLTRRFGKATATVIAPGGLSGDANSDSIVLEIEVAGRRVVFTGDSTGAGEAAAGAALARGPPVNVLKVSHHGSRYSTTTAFVVGARPRTAVISVGSNSYGHPSNDAVKRLRAGGARVFSTQRSGSITLTVTRAGALRWSYARSRAPHRAGSLGRRLVVEFVGRRLRRRSRRVRRGTRLILSLRLRRSDGVRHRHGGVLSPQGLRVSSRPAASRSSSATPKRTRYRPCSVCDSPR